MIATEALIADAREAVRLDPMRAETVAMLYDVINRLSEHEARLPDCPTCGGTGDLLDLICDNCGCSASLPLGVTCSNHLAKPSPCPAGCDHGKVTVAQLAALWRAVHSDEGMVIMPKGPGVPGIVAAVLATLRAVRP